jgi:hypothetical protein
MRNAALVAVILFPALCGCDVGPFSARGKQVPANEGKLFMSEGAREFSFHAVFHRENAEAGTWHLVVKEGGSMSPLAFFTTEVSPGHFYRSLRAIGATDGNNVSSMNMGDEKIATEGDSIQFLFSWEGRKNLIPLEDLVTEVVPSLPASGEALGLEMRFGGNYTGNDAASPPCHASGCLACLYTCSAGVTSNSRANLSLLRREKSVHRYRIQKDVDLPDGTRTTITVRRKI